MCSRFSDTVSYKIDLKAFGIPRDNRPAWELRNLRVSIKSSLSQNMSTRLPIGNREAFQLALPSIGQILYFFYFQETKTKKKFLVKWS